MGLLSDIFSHLKGIKGQPPSQQRNEPTMEARKKTTKQAPTMTLVPSIGSKVIKTEPSRDAIERRAYELFLSRGGEPGHEEEDWFTAERQLSAARN